MYPSGVASSPLLTADVKADVSPIRWSEAHKWNATCGVSLHAELIGRELLRRGYTLQVFAPLAESAGRWWHHRLIREDEPFVKRVYTELSPQGEEGRLNPEHVLREPPDVLIVESYEKLPYRDLERLVADLKKMGIPSLAVVHESSPQDLRYEDLSLFEYRREVLRDRAGSVNVEVLPYPCLPVREGKRRFAEDGKIVFLSFGRQPKEEYREYVSVLRRLREDYPQILYRVIRASDPLRLEEEWIEEELRILDIKDIYRLLHSSDIHLLPKGRTRRVVISSTLYQTLGSLCPTVAPMSRFFETIPRGDEAPLLLYEGEADLEEKLRSLLESEELRISLRENARRFVTENSVSRVVDRLEQILHRLTGT